MHASDGAGPDDSHSHMSEASFRSDLGASGAVSHYGPHERRDVIFLRLLAVPPIILAEGLSECAISCFPCFLPRPPPRRRRSSSSTPAFSTAPESPRARIGRWSCGTDASRPWDRMAVP